MKSYFLLIDFGATNIKAILWDADQDQFIDSKIFSSLENCAPEQQGVELSSKALHEKFIEIVNYYHHYENLIGILLCSQMHGFILLDEKNQALTNYISWQDERSLQPITGSSSFAMMTDAFCDSFQTISGMKPRPGLPIMNVFHLAREKKIKSRCVKVISLPEWLALIHQDAKPVVHATMLAGSGFLDIQQLQPSTALTDFIKDSTGHEFVFNALSPANTISGYFHLGKTKIPIYVGIGDHQCALRGAGFNKSMISLNIGTGSQISLLVSRENKSTLEKRPYFGEDILLTQTHIPAGRALNAYLSFLTDVIQITTGQTVSLWPYLNKLTADEILQSTLKIDLALFQSAINYQTGGQITGITLGNFTFKEYLGSLLKNFLLQYVTLIEKMGVQNDMSLMLSGGIPRKLPIIVEVLRALTGRKINSAANMDETLLGLRLQALAIVNNHAMCITVGE